MSETQETPVVSGAPKREVILNPEDIGLAQHRRQDFVCIAHEGVTVEDTLKPVFWSHYAARFQPFDRIEVREETGAWVAELMVMRAERNWASVALLNVHDLDKLRTSADTHDTSAYEVKWKGPVKKWCVIRKADTQLVHHGADSQEVALAWLRQYEVTMRR